MYIQNSKNQKIGFKALTPAASTCSPYILFQTYRKVKDLYFKENALAGKLKEEIAVKTLAREVFLFSSGKESLFHIFKLLKSKTNRDYVLLSAYTCPDIAVSAVSAGFKIKVLDLKANLLAMQDDNIPFPLENVAAVIFSNLYGYSEPLSNWQSLAEQFGFYLIDDACQAFHSKENGLRVGARGHFGIYSFGRGKAISGVGGGAISVNQLLPEERAAEFIIALGDIEAASRRSFTGVKDLLVGVLQYYFSMPLLYKIPLSLPFLKLGETNCKMHISKCKISEVQILFALAQLKDMEKNAAVFKNNSDLWCKALRERAANVFMFRASNEDCLTRLAILLPANESKRIFESKFRNYGLSASYPQTLVNYKELAGFIEHKELPESEKCSAQLFTLPLHRFVTPELIDAVVGMIGS